MRSDTIVIMSQSSTPSFDPSFSPSECFEGSEERHEFESSRGKSEAAPSFECGACEDEGMIDGQVFCDCAAGDRFCRDDWARRWDALLVEMGVIEKS